MWRRGHLNPIKYHGPRPPRFPDTVCNGLWEYRPDFKQPSWRAGATTTTLAYGPLVTASQTGPNLDAALLVTGTNFALNSTVTLYWGDSTTGTPLATAMINPRGAAELTLSGLAPGTYTVYCQVPGHRDAVRVDLGERAQEGQSGEGVG